MGDFKLGICIWGVPVQGPKGLQIVAEMGFKGAAIDLGKYEDGFWYTCEQIGLLCEKAKKYGIVVATENVLSIRDNLRMIEAVGNKQLKLIFDTQNYSMMKGYSAADHLRVLHPYVEQIHMKDGRDGMISSVLLGSGDSGFMETAEVIKETKCSKWLLLENYYHREPLSQMHPGPFAAIKRDMKIARKIFDL